MAEELGYSLATSPKSETPKAPDRDGLSESEFLNLAHDRFEQAQTDEEAQREREIEDLRFLVDQWPAAIRASREGTTTLPGVPASPPRPCFQIDKISPAITQVINQAEDSDLGIEIIPADDFEGVSGPIADEEIELREGLVRRIQRESDAIEARIWGLDRAVKSGRGYYRVLTQFAPGKTWDQNVIVSRIYNQFSVTLDPAHEQPDGSDAEWGFISTNLPWAQYKHEFPKNAKGQENVVCGCDREEDFRALGDESPKWFTGEGKTRACRVVEYYYTVRTSRKLCVLEDGSSAWEDELPEGGTPVDTREVVTKSIKWAKLDGVQILEETDWPSPYIPIVKILGIEVQPYDNERRAHGIVRPSRNAQEGFNAMVSKQVESVGLAPIPPWQMAAGVDEGFENEYLASTTRTLPVLHYNQVDSAGRPAPPPQRTNVDVPIQAIAESVQMFDQAVQTTTQVPEMMGHTVNPALKSGKALQLVDQQTQRGTSGYLTHLRRSVEYEAKIINSLLYPIYKRPGRLARLIDGQGEAQTVLLHQPMVSQDGRPIRAPEGHPKAKTYTLTKDASFNVAIKVSKSYDTRRQQEAETVGQLISAAPLLLTWFGDLFFKHQDGPGHEAMADRAKVMLDPKIQAMLQQQESGQPAVPPQAQQMLAQAQQVIQAGHQHIQQLEQQIQTEQVKQQATIQKAKIDADKDILLQQMRDATSIEVAKINALAKGVQIQQMAQNEALATGQEQAHEVGMAAMEHQHALEAGAQQAQNQQAMSAQQSDQQSQLAAQQAGHQSDLAEQQASLAPDPANDNPGPTE